MFSVFTVTAASSDIDKVGNTFLQLKLVINKGNKMENHYMGRCPLLFVSVKIHNLSMRMVVNAYTTLQVIVHALLYVTF